MNIMPKKTIAIVGAGPAGLFTAYELIKSSKYNNMNVYIIDKGRALISRVCPLRNGKDCAHCKPCNITHGFGGAGTFSDCKLSLSPHEVGGNIDKYVGDDKADTLSSKVQDIFDEFDEDKDKRKTIGREKNEDYKIIEEELDKIGLNLIYNPTKHLGTDGTYKVMEKLYLYLCQNRVNFIFNAEVTGFGINSNGTKKLYYDKNKVLDVDYIVFAPGRSGNKWLSGILSSHGINIKSNGMDIGFRVETPSYIVKTLTDNLYDMKIIMDCEDGGYVRTFCTNPNGFVSEEHYDDGCVLANGHSYADKKSDVTNFAVLYHYNDASVYDINTFRKRLIDFGKKYGIIVNNFNKAFGFNEEGFLTEPTLKSANKDLKLTDAYVKEHFERASNNIYNFMTTLGILFSGIDSALTNVYGMEAKFYSDLIEVNNNFETTIPGVYAIGDGSGVTRGIIQSCSTGLVVADHIMSKI